MAADRVFLDANVLFSAAYSLRHSLVPLWRQKGVELITSAYAVEEALRNLSLQEQHRRLEVLLARTSVVPESSLISLPDGVQLPGKDQPILSAAIRAGATHLLTGDKEHFGALIGKRVAGVLILSPAQYLNRPAGTFRRQNQ